MNMLVVLVLVVIYDIFYPCVYLICSAMLPSKSYKEYKFEANHDELKDSNRRCLYLNRPSSSFNKKLPSNSVSRQSFRLPLTFSTTDFHYKQ